MPKKETTVFIYVSGGNIQGVSANNPDVDIEIFDVDNLKAKGLSTSEIESLHEEEIKLYPYPIF